MLLAVILLACCVRRQKPPPHIADDSDDSDEDAGVDWQESGLGVVSMGNVEGHHRPGFVKKIALMAHAHGVHDDDGAAADAAAAHGVHDDDDVAADAAAAEPRA